MEKKFKEKIKKNSKLSKKENENKINSNSKSSKFKLVKDLRIRKESIRKALILKDGNLLVYFNGNILIYDKNDFSIKYKYEIKNGRICEIAQLTNGKVACCLTWPPNLWGERIIILNISNNNIEKIQDLKPILHGKFINLLGSLTSWELVLSEVGFCEFFELKNKKYVLKEKIEFKDNCFVLNFFELEKDKILFFGCYDSIKNFWEDYYSLKNVILIYDISNNKKELLFKINPINEFKYNNIKPILLNNKCLVFIKSGMPLGFILFDIKNMEFVTIFCSKNQNIITCITKLSENLFLVGDYNGYVTLYSFENNEILEIITKKLTKKIYEISKFNDNKFFLKDEKIIKIYEIN